MIQPETPLIMTEPTLTELITYCEAYVSGLKKEIANGDGEEWMHNSIRMEERIIVFLKAWVTIKSTKDLDTLWKKTEILRVRVK